MHALIIIFSIPLSPTNVCKQKSHDFERGGKKKKKRKKNWLAGNLSTRPNGRSSSRPTAANPVLPHSLSTCASSSTAISSSSAADSTAGSRAARPWQHAHLVIPRHPQVLSPSAFKCPTAPRRPESIDAGSHARSRMTCRCCCRNSKLHNSCLPRTF